MELEDRSRSSSLTARGIHRTLTTDPSGRPLKWHTFKQLIMGAHTPVRKHFFTGVGLFLQAKDATIAETVLLHFARKGIAVLPVHDSFIIARRYQAELELVMKDAFRTLMGCEIDVEASSSRDSAAEGHFTVSRMPTQRRDYVARQQAWFARTEGVTAEIAMGASESASLSEHAGATARSEAHRMGLVGHSDPDPMNARTL